MGGHYERVHGPRASVGALGEGREKEIEEVRRSTQRLVSDLCSLTDETVREPSLLPGWSRAHVLTHLARNADGYRHMAEGARRGERVEMYPGGHEGRARDIESGARRSLPAIVSDLTAASDRLRATWLELTEAQWALTGLVSNTPWGEVPIDWEVGARWREVEVHHVDLGIGYGPEDWPQAFVEATLERVIEDMPRRARGAPSEERWLLRATVSRRAWTISASGVADRALDAQHALSAADPHLLAWLLGREPDTVVVVDRSSDRAVALGLPRYFPFP